MRKVASIAVLLISLVIGRIIFTATKQSFEFPAQVPSTSVATTVPNAPAVMLQKMQTDGQRRHPELSQIEATKLEAIDSGTKLINDAKDKRHRRSIASSQFYGFYLINSVERNDYCARSGVDISSFIQKFTSVNSRELAQAKKIFAAEKVEPKTFYAQIAPQMQEMLASDMTAIKNQIKGNDRDACQLLNEASLSFVAENLSFSKTSPVSARALFEE